MPDSSPPGLQERLRRQPAGCAGWGRLVDLYTSWLQGWLSRLARLPEEGPEAEEVLRDVFLAVCGRHPGFETNGEAAPFRSRLRQALVHCLREHHERQRRGGGSGEPSAMLARLQDPHSDLTRVWDQEHQAHIIGELLRRGERCFPACSWQAFRRTALDGESASQVAAEMQVSPAAVLLARARVLAWLRREGGDLLEKGG